MSIDEPNLASDPRQPDTTIRRLRRTDFTAVMQLFADAGNAVPPPDRRSLRRFRHITDDLGAEVYIYLVDGALAGLIHLTYARQLANGPRAQVEILLVGNRFRRRGIGRALLDFGLRRAAKRSCSAVDCTLPSAGDDAARLLASAGFVSNGTTCRWSCAASAETTESA